MVNFGPLAKRFKRLVFTDAKSKLRVVCRLMQLRSGHVT